MGEPVSVHPFNTATGIDGINTDDLGMAVFRYENGVAFIKTCDDEVGGFLRRNLIVTGERGSLAIQPLEYYPALPESDKQTTTMNECFNTAVWQAEWTASTSEEFDRYDDMMKNFAEIVRGKENPYGYDYEMKLFELVMKACGKDTNI
jgi:predicted dehydrogenase